MSPDNQLLGNLHGMIHIIFPDVKVSSPAAPSITPVEPQSVPSKKPSRCQYCGRTFYRGDRLKEHVRTHTKEKPFACELCDASFARRGSWKAHALQHTGVKPFPCDVCGRTFKQKQHLTEHVQTHSTVRPYECHLCDKRFVCKKYLKGHVATHKHCCYVCEKSFPNEPALENHFKVHTSETALRCKVHGETRYEIDIIVGLTDCLKSEVDYDAADDCDIKETLVNVYSKCDVVVAKEAGQNYRLITAGCRIAPKNDL